MDMNQVEIVEFYPAVKRKSSNFVGTLHVYVPEKDLDICGVALYLNKLGPKRLFVQMPQQMGICHKTGNQVRYPVVSFTNPKKTNEIIESIRRQLNDFLASWFDERDEGNKIKEKLGLSCL